jgi:hypothetical protein
MWKRCLRRPGVRRKEKKSWKKKVQPTHYIRGQWVFGGIERGSGRTFLMHREKLVNVTVHHKTTGTGLRSNLGPRGAQMNDYIRTFTHKPTFYYTYNSLSVCW